MFEVLISQPEELQNRVELKKVEEIGHVSEVDLNEDQSVVQLLFFQRFGKSLKLRKHYAARLSSFH